MARYSVNLLVLKNVEDTLSLNPIASNILQDLMDLFVLDQNNSLAVETLLKMGIIEDVRKKEEYERQSRLMS